MQVWTALPINASPLFAQQALDRVHAGDDQISTYLGAEEDAFEWANTYQVMTGQRRLFCPPLKLALTDGQTTDILSRFVEANPKDANVPVGLVLLYALQDAFPCP
jgi:hypothetical protein